MLIVWWVLDNDSNGLGFQWHDLYVGYELMCLIIGSLPLDGFEIYEYVLNIYYYRML
jgi:hypothetical protein